jgi:RimJ/RimL family protein N-acetyltransferase
VRLELERCILRSWRLDDAPPLAAAANNRNVWLKLRDRMPHPYTLADAETYVRPRVDAASQPIFCIDVEGRFAGAIGLHPGEDVARLSAELGYWVAEPFWGRGVATDAVRGMVRHGFATLPLERIEAYVYANNPASVRVLEKCGFEFEGRLRRSVIKDGQILDSFLYAKLRDEVVSER